MKYIWHFFVAENKFWDGLWGDRPKTHNLNLGVEAKANDMELYESKVDVTSDYKVNLKQKVDAANQERIVFGQSVGGDRDSF